MSNEKILREIFTLAYKGHREILHKSTIAHHLTRICFGLFGMVESLKQLHEGSLQGYFDFNIYHTRVFSIPLILEHHLCTTKLKVKMENFYKKFHQGDEILARKGTFGCENTLNDIQYIKEITSEAIDYFAILYPEAIKMWIDEITEKQLKKAILENDPICLESLLTPHEANKKEMLPFIQRISKELLTP